MNKVSDYEFLEQAFKDAHVKFQPKGYETAPEGNFKELSETGITVLPRLINPALIDEIKAKFQNNIDSGKYLSRPRDLRKSGSDLSEIKIERLSDEDMLKGEQFFRDVTDNVQLRDPLVNMPELIDIALNKVILSLGAAYFGTFPKLTYLKLVKNYANKMEDFDTQFYHYDENAVKLLKAFIYLNDVVDETQGPFCYVKGSNLSARENWGKKIRYSDQDVASMCKKSNISPMFAKKGDVILANTVALHRGLKPESNDRNILIINYGIHRDYTFNNQLDITSKVRSKTLSKLTEAQQYATSLLEVI